jgi:CheY-like chemotaxis protein
MKTGILFAHPDHEVRIDALEVFEKAGYFAFTVDSGLDVMNWLHGDHDAPFDLVVIAVDLPALDGIGVLRRIRDNCRLKAVPVIVFAESDQKKQVVEGFAATFLHQTASFFEDLMGAVRQHAPA